MIKIKKLPRGLKICCGLTALLLVIVTIIIVTLCLTIFKPKQPYVTLNQMNLSLTSINGTPDFQIDLVVSIQNPNYGSFKYKNTTASVSYHKRIVAEVPIESRRVPARDELNFTTTADILDYKIVENPKYMEDLSAGQFNFSSKATLHGKVRVLKMFKFRATVFSTCQIFFFLNSWDFQSSCITEIDL
ncbi:hypothetical protein UlMin_022898 [Ulmus minor]